MAWIKAAAAMMVAIAASAARSEGEWGEVLGIRWGGRRRPATVRPRP